MGQSVLSLVGLCCLLALTGASEIENRHNKRGIEIGRASGGLIGSFTDGKNEGILVHNTGHHGISQRPTFSPQSNAFNSQAFVRGRFSGNDLEAKGFRGESANFGRVENLGSIRFNNVRPKNRQQTRIQIPTKKSHNLQQETHLSPNVVLQGHSLQGSFSSAKIDSQQGNILIPGRISHSGGGKSVAAPQNEKVHHPKIESLAPAQADDGFHGLSNAHLIGGIGGLPGQSQVIAKPPNIDKVTKGGRFGIGSLGNSLVDQAVKENGGNVLNSFWKDGQLHTTIVVDIGFDESDLDGAQIIDADSLNTDDNFLQNLKNTNFKDDISSEKHSIEQQQPFLLPNSLSLGKVQDVHSILRGNSGRVIQSSRQPSKSHHSRDESTVISLSPAKSQTLHGGSLRHGGDPVAASISGFHSGSRGKIRTSPTPANVIRGQGVHLRPSGSSFSDHRPHHPHSTRVSHNLGRTPGFRRPPPPRFSSFRGGHPRGFGATSFVRHRFGSGGIPPRHHFSRSRSPFPSFRGHRSIPPRPSSSGEEA